MLGKLLTTASIAAVMALAPGAALAQSNDGSNAEVILPKKGKAQQDGGNQGTNAQQSNEQNQQNGAQDTGQQDQAKGKKEMKQTDQNQATDQNQTTDQNQGKKKLQQTQDTNNDASGANTKTKQEKAASGEQAGDTRKAAAREIPTEKRTVVRERIISQKVQRVDRSKINFSINVGVAIPTTIELHPLPADIIEVVPDYSGFDYFVLADGTIIIVDPGTLQIVYVISA